MKSIFSVLALLFALSPVLQAGQKASYRISSPILAGGRVGSGELVPSAPARDKGELTVRSPGGQPREGHDISLVKCDSIDGIRIVPHSCEAMHYFSVLNQPIYLEEGYYWVLYMSTLYPRLVHIIPGRQVELELKEISNEQLGGKRYVYDGVNWDLTDQDMKGRLTQLMTLHALILTNDMQDMIEYACNSKPGSLGQLACKAYQPGATQHDLERLFDYDAKTSKTTFIQWGGRYRFNWTSHDLPFGVIHVNGRDKYWVFPGVYNFDHVYVDVSGSPDVHHIKEHIVVNE